MRTIVSRSWPAVITALFCALGLPFAFAQEPAAQEEPEPELEEVITIGTRSLLRSVEESPVPVDVISAGELVRSPNIPGELGGLLQALVPSFSMPRQSNSDQSDIVRPAQLRGLSPDQVLVLVNGKRRHTSALLNVNGSVGRGSSAVDLNMIPASAIERIEV
ncbi:MAG: TonB-dependent receptor plug domain-containing protein, partial [Xanthomonadales bacterium]|nr:TonB-dependent receptor plug domain-containing protein [Xanthomonadales bacterium]